MSDEGRLWVDPDPERHRRREDKNPAGGLPAHLVPEELKGRKGRLRARFVREIDGRQPQRCCFTGCTHAGAERHHFAPRAAFGALAEMYPTGWLCKEHHDLWHNALSNFFYDLHHDHLEAEIRYDLGVPE